MGEYYGIKDFILKKYDESYRSMGMNASNIDAFRLWRTKMRKKLLEISGIERLEKADMNPRIIETTKAEDYVMDKIVINTVESVKMPFYRITPVKNNSVGVIALHGHGSDGKNSLVGIIQEAVLGNYERFNYSYAMELKNRGYIVYVPDLCGSGERREAKEQDDIKKASCNNLNFALTSLGFSLIGFMTFELMCLVDFIQSDETVKLSNVSCCGFSGGGLGTLWLAALDDRIDCSVVSGYFHGFRGTILDNNLCGCNFAPNLWSMIDCGDLGAMIAPRRLMVESGSEDKLNGEGGMENVYSQIEIAKRAHDFYGHDSFKHSVCGGAHQWFGSCYDFIDDWSSEMIQNLFK